MRGYDVDWTSKFEEAIRADLYFKERLPKPTTPLESLFQGLKLLPEDIASSDWESWSKVLEELVPRERLILECRHGLAGRQRLTLKALGAWLGVTREWVRQLQERAHRRVRRLAVARGLIHEKAPDRLRLY